MLANEFLIKMLFTANLSLSLLSLPHTCISLGFLEAIEGCRLTAGTRVPPFLLGSKMASKRRPAVVIHPMGDQSLPLQRLWWRRCKKPWPPQSPGSHAANGLLTLVRFAPELDGSPPTGWSLPLLPLGYKVSFSLGFGRCCPNPQKMFCLIRCCLTLESGQKWGPWSQEIGIHFLEAACACCPAGRTFLVHCSGGKWQEWGRWYPWQGWQKQPGTSALNPYLLLCLHAEAEGRGGLSHQTISYAKSSLQLPKAKWIFRRWIM